MFEQECLQLLDKLFQKHQTVLMTGGSGLYIDAVCSGIDDFPTVDADIRKTVTGWFDAGGIEYLRRQLKMLDPEHYAKVEKRSFDIEKIILNRPREELFERINHRVTLMMESGLLQEAQALYPYRHLNALNTVGYKELFAYIDGQYDLNTAVELIRRNTRRYAKRQLTWFAREETPTKYFTFFPL